MQPENRPDSRNPAPGLKDASRAGCRGDSPGGEPSSLPVAAPTAGDDQPLDSLAQATMDPETAGVETWEVQPRQLHPLPPGLVELYGLLAVLFVLVPEWMASGALFGFREGRRGSQLPAPSGAWKRLPELRLASLNLAGLRQLAREQRLIGYSRLRREQLSARLLRRLKARP